MHVIEPVTFSYDFNLHAVCKLHHVSFKMRDWSRIPISFGDKDPTKQIFLEGKKCFQSAKVLQCIVSLSLPFRFHGFLFLVANHLSPLSLSFSRAFQFFRLLSTPLSWIFAKVGIIPVPYFEPNGALMLTSRTKEAAEPAQPNQRSTTQNNAVTDSLHPKPLLILRALREDFFRWIEYKTATKSASGVATFPPSQELSKLRYPSSQEVSFHTTSGSCWRRSLAGVRNLITVSRERSMSQRVSGRRHAMTRIRNTQVVTANFVTCLLYARFS